MPKVSCFRSIRPFDGTRLKTGISMDLLEEPFNVVPKGKDHDAHKENEANLLGEFSLPFSKGASKDSLEGKEQKMAAVEDWDGEQIQDTQIDAKDGH